jgi:hypothetical protein
MERAIVEGPRVEGQHACKLIGDRWEWDPTPLRRRANEPFPRWDGIKMPTRCAGEQDSQVLFFGRRVLFFGRASVTLADDGRDLCFFGRLLNGCVY